MNSINFEKYTYSSNEATPVSLVEYLVFSEEDAKYLVFKFSNNLNQRLNSITYQIDIFDDDYNLIERTEFTYSDFDCRQGEEFVTKQKLKVSKDLKHIKAHLINAKFVLSEYVNGELKELTGNDNKVEKSINLKEEKKLLKLKKKYLKGPKNRYKVKSVMKKKTPRYTRVIVTLASILLAIYMLVSVFLYVDMYGNTFIYNDITYTIKDDNLYVSEYNSNNKEVNIPDMLEIRKNLNTYRYNIVGISDKAFKNSNVEKITFNSYVTIGKESFKNSKINEIVNSYYVKEIGEYAFEGCKNLNKLELNTVSRVHMFAFKDCTNLTYLKAPNAIFDNNSLYKLDGLDTLSIKDTTSSNFADIFEVDSKIERKIANIEINRNQINTTYFLNIRFKNIYFNPSHTSVVYGSLYPYADVSGNVTYNSSHEFLDGVIVSTK